MSDRTTGRVIGALFLGAFVCYGFGGLLVESVAAGEGSLNAVGENQARLTSGAILMLANSVIVAAIGILAYAVFHRRQVAASLVYLIARVFEATVLAVGVVFVLLLVPLHEDPSASDALANVVYAGNDISFQIAMIGLGLGSVWFFGALLHDRLVPSAWAVWGIVGYAALALGAILELCGLGVGVWFAIPGGLFEVALGITLISRGLPEAIVAEEHASEPAELRQ